MHKNKINKQSAIFIGSPNSGKTTIYNWVTGSNFKTVNYPGATVDYSIGTPLNLYKCNFNVIDTPGIYSLNPKTADEQVTHNLLFNKEIAGNKVIVVVVDSTQFTRQILLAEQLKESGFNVIIALTMIDILKKNNINIDEEQMSQIVDMPVVTIDGRLGGNIKKLTQIIEGQFKENNTIRNIQWNNNTYKLKFDQYEKIRKKIITTNDNQPIPSDFNQKLNQKYDKWILHPFLGLIIFFIVMFSIFSSVFWLAAPAIDFVDSIFANMSDFILETWPHSLFAEFLANGLIAGIGAFAVFVPQIAILFLGLSILEDSGYMARASALIDRPLSKIGMNGRSFVPILSSFACAVPGMMAARTIPNKKERLLTLFILPLMTCSARIPVYALMLAFLFAGKSAWIAGLAMALIYFASVIMGGITAAIINRFLPKTKDSFFILELPSYRRPIIKKTIKNVYDRTTAFVKRAGPIIFTLSVLIWFLSTFPNHKADNDFERFNSSYAAQFGQYIEPVFKPMGADWRVGLGILTSFAAREVFVSTLAIVFNVASDDEDEMTNSLLDKMKYAHFNNSASQGETQILGETKIFTLPTIVALIIFFMIALQCMATVSVAKREFGGWPMALTQLFIYNGIAYALAVGAYQLLSLVY